MYSSLCSLWWTSPNKSSREGRPITRITIHHAAGICTASGLLETFSRPERRASANYVIGSDGEIGGCVPEEDMAWTSNSKSNDIRAITIEVGNNVNAEPWSIGAGARDSLIKLCVDICRRYVFNLWWDPEVKTGSLTAHRWYAATACPGDWLYARFPEIIDTVNKEVKMYDDILARLDRLEQLVLAKWQTVDDVPDWARPTVRKLVDDGALKGTGDGLNIDEIMARTLVVCDREGAF